MATTTAKKKPASTRKKSTTKKPAAKKPAVKKTAAKATTKSTSKAAPKTVKKSAEKKTEAVSVASTKKQMTPFDRLRSLHVTNFLTAIILGILTMIVLNPINKSIYLTYPANNSFIKSDQVNLDMATENFFTFDARYGLVAILGLTALVSILLATKLYDKYKRSVENKASGLRWMLYGIVSAVVFEFVSIMANVQDAMTLKMVGITVILAAVLAWISERENATKKSNKLAFYGAILATVFAFVPMVVNSVTVSIVSGERFSWYVYAMGIVLLIGSIYSLVTLKSYITGKTKFEYVALEQRYIRIDQILKFIIVICIFSVYNKYN